MCSSDLLFKVALKKTGLIDENDLFNKLDERTKLVSLIYAHNETGCINPIPSLVEKINELCPQAHIHVDGVQAIGKMDTSWVHKSSLHSMSASAHKIGGLKGVGCLYLKSNTFLEPLIYGGGQEKKLRSGTENMPGIISFGLRAKEIMSSPSWNKKAEIVRDMFLVKLKKIPGVVIHSEGAPVLSNTVNFHIEEISGDVMMLQFDLANIAASNGSACSSGEGIPSSVLLAMGYSEWVASNSIRLSFGAGSTADDVERFISVIKQVQSS